MASWIITLFYLLTASAIGQDGITDPVDAVGPPTVLPADSERLEQIFRERWQRRSLLTSFASLSVDVAVAKHEPSLAAILARDGRVWVTENGGLNWSLVMGPVDTAATSQSADEEALLGVEARIDELVDAAEVRDLEEMEEEFEGFTEDQLGEEMTREATEALQEAISELQADMDADPDFITGQAPIGASPSRVWVQKGGFLFVSREDGFWVSEDLGRRWHKGMEARPLSLLRLPSGMWISGTADGIRIAIRPTSWIDLDDETDGFRIEALINVPSGVLASGPKGLWYSADGQSWRRRGVSLGGVQVMRSNPRIPSEVWFVSDNGLVTSADDGESFWPSVPITVPMDGVRSMLMLDVGRILMSGRDGVMETTDGGVTWRLFNRGLSHADDAKLFSWGPEGPHALSGGSVYRLGPAPIEDGSLERVAEWVPVGALVDGAVDRIGMEMVPDLRRRRVAAWLSPILTVEGRYRDNVVLGWNRYSGSRFDTRGEAIGLIRFYWRPRNRTRSDVGVLTNGSRPLIIAGGRDGASALRLNQQLASYRADLADRIVGLFRTRRNLVIEREQMMEADLLEQVVHELMIRHIEADLDALSGNMVSRWRDR